MLVLLGGYWYFFVHRAAPAQQLVTVTKGTITQTVEVTGNTTPTQSVSLGFESAGTVAHVYKELGAVVYTGEVIAALNTAHLDAALAQAQANVAAQQARLDDIKAGAQPADIAVSKAAYQKTEQDLTNLYGSVSDTLTSAYAKAHDAVRVQLSALFDGAESDHPALTFATSESQAATNAQLLRVAARDALDAWAGSQPYGDDIATTTLMADLTTARSRLATVQQLLTQVSSTLDGSTTLTPTQRATYKASVAVAVTETNAALSSVNTLIQTVAAQRAVVAQAQAQLTLKEAGATSEQIATQMALVEQAQAQVTAARANLSNARIVAPIAGIITEQDAKVGQQATPGMPLVSIISTAGFEVDAGISEIDVGKVRIGDGVSMTLDAFPGEVFTGTVFYLAPAPTNNQGVITYLTKVSFSKPDGRLKSGLTANLTITTAEKEGVLIVPQYTLVQKDEGTFVQVLMNGSLTEVPVMTGLQDREGNVEVLSGVTEGQRVAPVGLK